MLVPAQNLKIKQFSDKLIKKLGCRSGVETGPMDQEDPDWQFGFKTKKKKKKNSTEQN
jgi:hypothetical protein